MGARSDLDEFRRALREATREVKNLSVAARQQGGAAAPGGAPAAPSAPGGQGPTSRGNALHSGLGLAVAGAAAVSLGKFTGQIAGGLGGQLFLGGGISSNAVGLELARAGGGLLDFFGLPGGRDLLDLVKPTDRAAQITKELLGPLARVRGVDEDLARKVFDIHQARESRAVSFERMVDRLANMGQPGSVVGVVAQRALSQQGVIGSLSRAAFRWGMRMNIDLTDDPEERRWWRRFYGEALRIW